MNNINDLKYLEIKVKNSFIIVKNNQKILQETLEKIKKIDKQKILSEKDKEYIHTFISKVITNYRNTKWRFFKRDFFETNKKSLQEIIQIYKNKLDKQSNESTIKDAIFLLKKINELYEEFLKNWSIKTNSPKELPESNTNTEDNSFFIDSIRKAQKIEEYQKQAELPPTTKQKLLQHKQIEWDFLNKAKQNISEINATIESEERDKDKIFKNIEKSIENTTQLIELIQPIIPDSTVLEKIIQSKQRLERRVQDDYQKKASTFTSSKIILADIKRYTEKIIKIIKIEDKEIIHTLQHFLNEFSKVGKKINKSDSKITTFSKFFDSRKKKEFTLLFKTIYKFQKNIIKESEHDEFKAELFFGLHKQIEELYISIKNFHNHHSKAAENYLYLVDLEEKNRAKYSKKQIQNTFENHNTPHEQRQEFNHYIEKELLPQYLSLVDQISRFKANLAEFIQKLQSQFK